MDDLSTGRNQVAGVGFHELDVTDPRLVELAAAWRPEVVCHLAAQVSVRVSVGDPVKDARTNVLGTVNVLEAARRAGSRKVVYTSSCAVYGRPATLPVPAGAVPAPASPYAASKATGEVYLETYRVLHGLDYTTLTLANVYGPRQTPEGEAGVISIFTDALLNRRPTQIFGNGKNTRDYVYVLDVVDAFARACGSAGGGRRFNIGTGLETTDRDLHALVAELAGAPDDPVFAAARLGDLPAMSLDPQPALDGLGWRPRTSLRDGLEATLDWARRS